MIVAGVVDGRLLPICGLIVQRTAGREHLVEEGEDPYELPLLRRGQAGKSADEPSPHRRPAS